MKRWCFYILIVTILISECLSYDHIKTDKNNLYSTNNDLNQYTLYDQNRRIVFDLYNNIAKKDYNGIMGSSSDSDNSNILSGGATSGSDSITTTSSSSSSGSSSNHKSSSESDNSLSSESPSSASSSDSFTPININGTLTSTASVYFSGGSDKCGPNNCSSIGYIGANNFACSYQVPGFQLGNWDNGIKYFQDPLPKDVETSQVIGISFNISGVVGCINSFQYTSVSFSIQDVAIGNQIKTNRTDNCFCGYCHLNYEIPPQTYEMYGYNRSGINKFQIQVPHNHICVSDISIIFYFNPSSPSSGSLTPLKKYLIIGFSTFAGFLLISGAVILIRLKFKKSPKKLGYSQIKDGKDIDVQQIRLGHRIGKGNFGEVFLGTWRGSQVAVKKLPVHNINENVLKEFHREIDLMKNLRHPNVIQFLGSCSIPPDICICTEFMPRGSLYSNLHNESLKLSWDLIIRMMVDSAKGIIYLHGSNPVILHRDLKSHNLLVDENWKVKVADFGLSTIEQQGATMTACGTPCWTSPEVLRSQRYTEKADVYSFGIILWECATRQDPYFGIPPFQVIFAVGREGLRPPVPKLGPPQYIRLIIDCLNENPSNRPTMEECLERLESIDTTGFGDIIISNPQDNILIN